MRILLAERDAETRRTLSEQLTGLGWEVVEAPDGLEAVRLVAQWQFDCLAVDLRLSRVNGFDVLRRARHEQPSARRIALSRRSRTMLGSVDPSLVDGTVPAASLASCVGAAGVLAA